jgi:hypothetical protein
MPTLMPPVTNWVVGVQYWTSPIARIIPRWCWGSDRLEQALRRRMRIAWSENVSRASPPSNLVSPLGPSTNLIILR